MIYCYYEQNEGINKYFWKVATEEYTYVQTPNTWIHKDRLSLLNNDGVLIVIYRNLSLQDAGLYQCGETGAWSHDMNLTVKSGEKC